MLVNKAGIFCVKPIVATTLEELRRMQQINVEGVFLGMKHSIPAIAERAQQWDGGGSIIKSRRSPALSARRCWCPTTPRKARCA